MHPSHSPPGAHSIWTLIPTPQGGGIISANPRPLALWGVNILATKNRRTQCGPFALIHINNDWRTDGPIGGQKVVPQLILPEDL